jgi:hypothetical protein
MNVWVVDRIGPKLPVAIYARNDIPAEKDWYDAVDGLQAKVAEQSAATLAKTIANRSRYVLLGKRAARRTQGPLRSNGADFSGGCPQDPEYGHSFRKQAKEIDFFEPPQPCQNLQPLHPPFGLRTPILRPERTLFLKSNIG